MTERCTNRTASALKFNKFCLRSSKQRRLRSSTTDWTDGLDKWQMISLQLCYIFLSFFWLLHTSLAWPAALGTICHFQTPSQPITVIGSWWFWNYWSSENFIDKACLQSVYYLVLSFNLENCGAHLNLHDFILLWGYLEREFEEDPSVLRAIEICIWDSVRVRTLINSEIRQSLKKIPSVKSGWSL